MKGTVSVTSELQLLENTTVATIPSPSPLKKTEATKVTMQRTVEIKRHSSTEAPRGTSKHTNFSIKDRNGALLEGKASQLRPDQSNDTKLYNDTKIRVASAAPDKEPDSSTGAIIGTVIAIVILFGCGVAAGIWWQRVQKLNGQHAGPSNRTHSRPARTNRNESPANNQDGPDHEVKEITIFSNPAFNLHTQGEATVACMCVRLYKQNRR